MTKGAVVTYSDGKIDLPLEVQEELHLTNGTKLHLLLTSKTGLRLEREDDPRGAWVPNEDWRSLQGILSGHPEHDTSKARAEERAWELEHDERKFGPFPKQ